ncbi:hypothetical protein BU23DRAFT_268669 [Bimuria novae-zelandiae CBS 107.79]|uniref:Uncharacterized protein n=1 Tax=Bimuria novae-zelandiae CBS 107.79 TaxID=1447943 RepID=A0A6A5UTS1_9PLEO|nr:hypothetical protein BU23DRAFT_268669 [Bimuria novae-zelandiae CBS 107.79]
MAFGREPARDDMAIETVDLTLSSPSPEPQPRPRPQPPQQHARQQRTPVNPNVGRGVQQRKANAGPSRPPPSPGSALAVPVISEDHLRRIINTAPIGDLKETLVKLCRSSPALSGAVVRHLAPNSTWAKDTIEDYQRRTAASLVKPELGSSSSAAFQRPSVTKYDYGHPTTPHPKAHVKHEVDTLDYESDDYSSDLEGFPPKSSRSSNFPTRTAAGPSPSYRATNDRNPAGDEVPHDHGNSTLSVRVKPEPSATASTCIQCNQIYQPGSGSRCHYHLGRIKVEKQGSQKIKLWTCCERWEGRIGCREGDHIPLKEDRSNVNPGSTGSKKPRLL